MAKPNRATLDDVREELQTSNRLIILSLVCGGVQQKDIAAAIGASESVVSRMFPRGLLKRVAQSHNGSPGHNE